MNTIQQLLTEHLDIWTAADTEKKSGRGRSSSNGSSVYGIKKLRELILELAVRGKLVPQDPNDEPASVLLERIQAEKAKLIAEGKIKKDKPLAPITKEEKLFGLPPGWKWVRLGDITNFGSTLKLNVIDNDVWVLDLEDIEKDTSNLLQKIRFSERGSLSDKNSFQKGDVLYGKLRPYLNKVIVADEDGVCTTEILPIRCYGPFNSDYFKVALKSPYFIKYVNKRSYGMKMPRLGTEDGRKAVFPLAPITEQHRIVAKVDELIAICVQLETQHNNAAEGHEKLVNHLLGTLTQSQSAEEFSENWQRIGAHFDTLFTTESSIDILKQTLLQLAVMGKLVPQDPNDEPARVLLKRIHAEKTKLATEGKLKKEKPHARINIEEKLFQLPPGWEWVRFGDVYSLEYGDNLPSEKRSNTGEYPVYGSNGVVGSHNVCFIHSSCVVVGRKGSAGALNLSLAKGCCVTDVAYYCVPSKHLDLIFTFKLFHTLGLDSLGKGIKPGLNRNDAYGMPIAIPPLAEQHRIVSKVDELMALCDRLKSLITEANQLQQKLADVMVEKAVV